MVVLDFWRHEVILFIHYDITSARERAYDQLRQSCAAQVLYCHQHLCALTMPFSFLKLPRELRDQIYLHCFPVSDGGTTVTPDLDRSRRETAGCDSSRTINGNVALLQACRQIHGEAAESLYGGR